MEQPCWQAVSNVCVVGTEKSEEPTAALDGADAQGEIDLDTACMALRRYELRRRIERFFHALKFGSRLELAGDLRKCLPFDAITAFRVWDIPILDRARRDDPTGRRVCGDDIRALCALASRYGFTEFAVADALPGPGTVHRQSSVPPRSILPGSSGSGCCRWSPAAGPPRPPRPQGPCRRGHGANEPGCYNRNLIISMMSGFQSYGGIQLLCDRACVMAPLKSCHTPG